MLQHYNFNQNYVSLFIPKDFYAYIFDKNDHYFLHHIIFFFKNIIHTNNEHVLLYELHFERESSHFLICRNPSQSRSLCMTTFVYDKETWMIVELLKVCNWRQIRKKIEIALDDHVRYAWSFIV